MVAAVFRSASTSFLVLFVTLGSLGCNRSTAEIYCDELAACWDEVLPGNIRQSGVDDCVDALDEDLDGLSSAERQPFEDGVQSCNDEESCAFIVCMCDHDLLSDHTCDPARKHL